MQDHSFGIDGLEYNFANDTISVVFANELPEGAQTWRGCQRRHPPKDWVLRMLDTVDRVDDKALLVLVGS
jgi:hypothetical protein